MAQLYERIFAGVETAADWLALIPAERDLRVSPLGFGPAKRAAMDSIAQALIDGDAAVAHLLERRPGLGPYMAGMVALLCDGEGAPVDTNVARLGGRAGGDAERWIADVVRAALGSVSRTGLPPAYEAVCAVLDLGHKRCHAAGPECFQCPLHDLCAARPALFRQLEFPWERDRRPPYYHTTRRVCQILNVDCMDGEVRTVTVDIGIHGNEPLVLGGSGNALGAPLSAVAREIAYGFADWPPAWCRVSMGTARATAWALE